MPKEPSRPPLLVYIQGMLPSLNPAERLIADYVLQDPERILSSSIADMRDGSGASVGSIVGFCHGLGLKGFAAFKIALARELAQSGFSGFAPGAAGSVSEQGTVFEKVFRFHAQSLADTLQINSQKTMRQAARALDGARRIELFAIGISYPIAYLASSKLRLIGLPASTQFDSHMHHADAQGRCGLRNIVLGYDQRDGALSRGGSFAGCAHDLPDQLDEVADYASGRSVPVRDSERNQIFSSAAGFPHYPAGDCGCLVRIARSEKQGTDGGAVAQRRRGTIEATADLTVRSAHLQPIGLQPIGHDCISVILYTG